MSEERFEQIAEKVVAEAADVKCDIPEYIAGLRHIIAELEVSRQAAEEDLE